MHTHNWLNKAVFYEIYPQSFCDSNGDGVGDLQGIIRKLDEIQALGCTAIWLNPCFLSPFGDAGYDVSDYFRIAPRYGTNADMQQLIEAVHLRGMRILLDLVPGHTSVEHPWFKESMKAERNAYTDRYIWTDSIWKEPYGMGNIRGISERDGCCAVNFFSHQPALNYGFYQPDPNEPWQQPMDAPGPQATIEAMKDVMRFWLGMGVDGFRVDMAGSLVKHDPEQKGTIRLWRGIRAFLDREYPDAVLISEWGEPDKSLEGGFHMDFLLHFGPSHYNDLFRCEEPYFCERGKGDAAAFVAKYTENLEKTRGKGLICIPSGNHDMDRLARKLSENALRIAFAFLLSMPGVPFLYYGDEIGMRYVEGPASVEGGYGRTGSRSPMQWDSSTNAGFSAAPTEVLYLPLDADPNRPNVAAQRQNPNSLWHTVHQLIEVRKAHTALQGYGEIQFLYAQPNAYPLVYLRSSGNERILVVINPCGTAQTLELSEVPKETLFAYGGTVTMENGKLRIPACSAGYYLV